ncbi:MAG: mannose-1-phosphate guanylyltransferase [Planctomycetota bacterium]
MAGGSGTRFWPASRNQTPKQLLNLAGAQTMIQSTISRLGQYIPPERVLILTNQKLVKPVMDQLPQLPPGAVIGEPCKRDTAPCIGLAAVLLAKQDPEATMVVMPADHVIGPDEVFQQAVDQAVKLVEQDPRRIVTFGIQPTYAAESFGYIERGQALKDAGTVPAYQVRRFCEKPTGDVARHYVESGEYYWNSGIFAWKARTILDALRHFAPDIHQHIAAIGETIGTPDFDRTLRREFASIEGQSIDYAVMEHYQNVVVIEAPYQWDDLGSWRALARLHGTDEQSNTRLGRTLTVRTSNSIIRSTGNHLIATIGVDNLIVVHTPDATLVARQDDEEAVRDIVKLIEERGWHEYL